ncbi:aldo/keto reductase [Piscinibacter sp. XHJ-5]|uniref:aldo/keto reductase n=1 Tax=Piscinibacter sp. XHJ-5 TaxID=3037797 RepID=UPI002453145E|nr:aldo/keto reductase [Piscinibacter sp. XHJ-5]
MDRRSFLALTPAVLATPAVSAPPVFPPIGLGTWLTFDVGDDSGERAQRREVLARFFAAGGGMIDSSPMYGRAERLLGELLPSLPHAGRLIAASKVWTPFDRLGPGQLEHSMRLWGLPQFDVLLVHNLLNWRDHVKTLRRWKDDGRVRRIGVSTSHGRRHDEAMRVIRAESLDVLQITYNLADTSAEPVMNLAAERGMAVVINRPFDGGDLFEQVSRRPLPPWAEELGCSNWAQFFLRWIVAHPAVTCAIPATRNPAHLEQNMAAARQPIPDAAARQRMQAHWRKP